MHLLDCKIYIQYDKKTDSLGNHYLFKQFIFTDDCVTENELKRKIHFDQQQTQLDFFDWGHVAPPFQRELLQKKSFLLMRMFIKSISNLLGGKKSFEMLFIRKINRF